VTHANQHRRVLLVDDEPDLLAILASLLEDEGYSVATATSGPEAVERARGEHFDVVVSDLKMPGMGGLEILAAIGAVDPDVRSVLMTGFVSEETRSLLASQGCPCLMKPFDIEEIVEVMKSAGGPAA
jgi:CheY-like chemotaxis protein